MRGGGGGGGRARWGRPDRNTTAAEAAADMAAAASVRLVTGAGAAAEAPIESVGKSNVGRWRGSGTRFVPRNGCYPHFEPICGYLGHPTHAKYRSVRTAVATHVALVVPPPLVPDWAGHPQRALVSPVPSVSRRRIILHHTSCQPAPWPPRCRYPPPPPPPPLTAGAPPPRTRTLPTASHLHRPPPALSYGRSERPPRGRG